MRPLLGELAASVDEIIEAGPIVGAEARERNQIMRGHEDIDVIDLQQAKLVDNAAEVLRGDGAARAWAIETLRGQGDAASFGKREIGARHFLNVAQGLVPGRAWPCPTNYSWRRASIGSTRVARRAGM